MLEILNNEKIRGYLKEISDNQEERLYTCHGYKHAFKVVNFAKELCNLLSLSDKDVVVAAMVHDVGMIADKKDHALRSYELLKENTDFNDNILNAVKYHSFLEEIHSYEGAILAIADKIDLDKSRMLPLGYKDDFHNRILTNIEKTVVTARGNTIIINYETSGTCDLYLYEKYFKILEKAFGYLQVDYDVRINDISILEK